MSQIHKSLVSKLGIKGVTKVCNLLFEKAQVKKIPFKNVYNITKYYLLYCFCRVRTFNPLSKMGFVGG